MDSDWWAQTTLQKSWCNGFHCMGKIPEKKDLTQPGKVLGLADTDTLDGGLRRRRMSTLELFARDLERWPRPALDSRESWTAFGSS